MRNLYETLGLKRGASAQDIKRAYHRLAHQNHPDKNPGDKAAEERFKEASRAYDILSDAKRRTRYDRFGPAGVGLGGEASALGAQFAQSVGESVGELFEEIFGRRRRPANPSANSAAAESRTLQIDLATAVLGGQTSLPLVRHERCTSCAGNGAEPGQARQACTPCQATGSLRVKQGVFSIGKRCPHCAGQGYIITHLCSSCQGRGQTSRQTTLKLRIPKGAQSGTVLRLKSEGEVLQNGAQADLLVTLRVQEHAHYSQHELELRRAWPVTIFEAALGATLQIPFVDGAPITITIPPGSQHGDVVRAPGQGAYRLGHPERGDLCISLHLEVPKSLEAQAQNHLRALGQLDVATHYPKRHAAEQSFGAGAAQTPQSTP